MSPGKGKGAQRVIQRIKKGRKRRGQAVSNPTNIGKDPGGFRRGSPSMGSICLLYEEETNSLRGEPACQREQKGRFPGTRAELEGRTSDLALAKKTFWDDSGTTAWGEGGEEGS